MKTNSQALQVLKENYKNSSVEMSFKEFVEIESQNDPGFFRFFFGTDLDQDYDISLSDEQKEYFEKFLKSL